MQDFKKKHIFLDIETLPTEDPIARQRVVDKLKAPGNYKKPEAIQKWMDENMEDAVLKTALSGLYGSILCIGVAIEDEDPQIIKGDEIDILTQWSELTSGIESPVYVGHNVREFDIKFIIQRQFIHGLKPMFSYKEPYYERPIRDTMEIFSVNPRDRVSLDNLCFVLGVDAPKGDIDGSKVYEYYQAGKQDEIYAYCLDDVSATRQCFKKLTQA